MIYTDIQKEWILNNYKECNSYKEFTEKFNQKFELHKSVNALSQFLTKTLGIYIETKKTKMRFSKDEEQWLIDNYSKFMSYDELTKQFNKTFNRQKDKKHLQDKCIKRLKLKGMPNITKFQKGHLQRQCPVGTIRKSDNGITYIKVLENAYSYISGYKEPYWLPIQKKIWQDYYGKVPKGKMVIFLDGNKSNLDINNLYCIDRRISVVMAKNKWYTNSKEHTLTAIKWCELYYALNNKK